MSILSSLPGYQNYEYLLVVSPHEDLQNRILNIKHEFATNYNLSSLKVSRPLIPLLKFFSWSMMEEKIVHRLKTISMGSVPFKVELKDYGSFPSHTLFINVSTKVPIQNLVKDLHEIQHLLKAHPDHDTHFITEPHITIACKLKPWQYEKGWSEYSHLHFTARFIADGMLLLKRSAVDKPYQVVTRLEFMNLPVNTKQGNLFM